MRKRQHPSPDTVAAILAAIVGLLIVYLMFMTGQLS